MHDRQPKYPGRIKLRDVETGEEKIYDMTMADEPTVEGDAPVTKNLLKQITAAMFGLGADAVPNSVFKVIRGPGAVTTKAKVAQEQTIEVGSPVAVSASGGSIATIPVGTVVKINESGVPVNYIIVNQGIPGNSELYDASCAGTWVLRQDIYVNSKWDTDFAAALPDSTIMGAMASMLSLFDPSIQSAIKTVKIPYSAGNGSSTVYSGANGLQCKLFPLSVYELGLSNNYYPIDGAQLSYFVSGTSSAAQALRVAKLSGSAATWWTRSQYNGMQNNAGCITPSGSIEYYAAGGNYGVRPAFVLPSTVYVQPDGTVTTSVVVPEYTVAQNGTQAIALENGSAGDTIEVIFAGTVIADWVTQDQQITSDGVKGVGMLPGVLQVAGANSPGVKVVTGSYVGTESYGESNPNTLTFSFVPKFVVVSSNQPSTTTMFFWLPGALETHAYMTEADNIYFTQSGTSLSWYNATSAQRQYNSGTFNYIAIG